MTAPDPAGVRPDDPLGALARAFGVATAYTGADGARVQVPATTVQAVLAAMGVAVADPQRTRAALRAADERPWRRLAPSSVVTRNGRPASVVVRLPEDARLTAELTLEGGASIGLAADAAGDDARDVGGVRRRAAALALPLDLAPGYHRLVVRAERAGTTETAETLVIAAPARCPLPIAAPAWGWMLQLYGLRSSGSWGIGDLADLRALARWTAAEHGAGMLLVNPLHAAAPVLPQEPSPYYPSSRRFTNPLYLRVTDIPEVTALDPDARVRLAALAGAAGGAGGAEPDRIDRDAVFRAKREAFAAIYAVPRGAARDQAFAAYRRREGQGLTDFATFCALAERHGTPWQSWPPELRHPGAAAVARARRELADRVDFHAWLQWQCDEQLAAAQGTAVHAGMPVGVVHDLAVGVDPGGADAWALQDDLASAVTVGAPPDAFNRRGQDWRLPPLLPQRLADTGFAPFRDMLRSVLRHAGGLRVDHVMGLFRLFWIPEGQPPAAGTYVRYPAADLLGVVALEAQRAGALVIGEDLGTVEEGVRDTLADWAVLGSQVLYFARDADGRRLPAAGYPRLALATVTTHDLPTAAGWWQDETVRIQAELGLLPDGATLPDALERRRRERAELAALLRAEGLVGADPSTADLVLAMHAFLARTPSLLVAAALGDALGDGRQPNLPGTTDEYPNWRLPLAEQRDGRPRPVTLEELRGHPLVQRVAHVLTRRRA